MSKPCDARCWTMPSEWIAEIEATVNGSSHAGRVTVHVDLGATGRPTELLVQPPARRVRAGEGERKADAR